MTTFTERLLEILTLFQQEVISTAFEDEKPNCDSPKLWKQDEESFERAKQSIRSLIKEELLLETECKCLGGFNQKKCNGCIQAEYRCAILERLKK